MKHFLKKILVLGFVIATIVSLFFVLNKLVLTKAYYAKTAENINTLIVGASRTACGINDQHLVNTLNISDNGDALLFSKLKIKLFTENNPNINRVLLSFDNRTISNTTVNNFYDSSSLKGRIPKYCYYFSLNDWKKVFQFNSKAVCKNIFSIPKYSFKLFAGSSKKSKIKSMDIGGYYYFDRILKENEITAQLEKIKDPQYKISKEELTNLYEIIDFCKKNKLELIFVSPPIHKALYNSLEYQKNLTSLKSFIKQDKKLASINYLDFTNDLFPDSFYGDLIHLNTKGAEAFSKKLNVILNKID